jgi:flagellar basal body-associated protein FliL
MEKIKSVLDGVYRVQLIILAIMFLGIVTGTLYALVFRENPGEPLYTIPDSAKQTPEAVLAPGEEIVFTGIGRLRLGTADQKTALVSAVFPYNPRDRAFTEELVFRIPDFRQTLTGYVGGLTSQELREADDAAIKAEILQRFNGLLHLGSIETLYFNDLIVIE